MGVLNSVHHVQNLIQCCISRSIDNRSKITSNNNFVREFISLPDNTTRKKNSQKAITPPLLKEKVKGQALELT